MFDDYLFLGVLYTPHPPILPHIESQALSLLYRNANYTDIDFRLFICVFLLTKLSFCRYFTQLDFRFHERSLL
jgi:hypothetical protein